MKSYYFWTSQAERFSRSVDFGSPMSAWTQAMRDEHQAAQREGRQPSMANVRKQP